MPFSGVGRLHRHYAADQCAGEMGAGQCDNQVRFFFFKLLAKVVSISGKVFVFVFVDVFLLADSLVFVVMIAVVARYVEDFAIS